jgi:hypothetical protein
MRIKIIAVNALIVAIVGLLSFLLVRSALGIATGNKDQLTAEAQNDVNGAAARLQLDGLRAPRPRASRPRLTRWRRRLRWPEARRRPSAATTSSAR